MTAAEMECSFALCQLLPKYGKKMKRTKEYKMLKSDMKKNISNNG